MSAAVSLLDINVIVALFDPGHVHHESAHQWFGRFGADGWASSPLTENGFVRIVSNPAYPGRGTTVPDAIRRLAEFRSSGHHAFWHDTVSLCEDDRVNWRRIRGHRQLTDIYLLALAVRHGGRLVTFDRSIPLDAVPDAEAHNLTVIDS